MANNSGEANTLVNIASATEPAVSTANIENLGPSREIFVNTRNRPCNEMAWKRNVIKTKRNSGAEYINYSGKVIPAKTFQRVNCNCVRRCSLKVTSETQQQIHSRFYGLDWDGQTAWICASVKIISPKRRKKRNSRKPSYKQHTRQYFFNELQVCKLLAPNFQQEVGLCTN